MYKADIVYKAGKMIVREKYHILNGRKFSQTIGCGEYGMFISQATTKNSVKNS